MDYASEVGRDLENEKERRPYDARREIGKVERLSTKNEFKCPVAIFEPPDPAKKPMYPKDLVSERFPLDHLSVNTYLRIILFYL